jgi:putative endonuclease
VGFTSKILELRLNEHNEGKNNYTRNSRPYKLIYSELFSEEQVACQREKFFKTGNGRKFLDKIIPP